MCPGLLAGLCCTGLHQPGLSWSLLLSTLGAAPGVARRLPCLPWTFTLASRCLQVPLVSGQDQACTQHHATPSSTPCLIFDRCLLQLATGRGSGSIS